MAGSRSTCLSCSRFGAYLLAYLKSNQTNNQSPTIELALVGSREKVSRVFKVGESKRELEKWLETKALAARGVAGSVLTFLAYYRKSNPSNKQLPPSILLY